MGRGGLGAGENGSDNFRCIFILGAVVENTIWMTHVFSIILCGWKWDTCDEAEKETLRDSETAFV